MENRAYEDEANKAAHHQHYHHYQQQQQLLHKHQQHQQFNHIMHSHPQQHQQQHHPHHHPDDEFSHDPPQISEGSHHLHQNHLVQPRFDTYRGLEMPQHTADCHVYEDIVPPYGLALEPGGGGGGGFQRNLTLPLRRTSQSCESIETNPQSSSVRVTNRERTRGSVIDRLTRDDRNRDSGHNDSIVSGTSSNSNTDRPQRRRRKKDCKHCKIKAIACSAEEAKQRDEHAVYEERSAELRAIFGLPDVGLCRLAPGCLSTGVVYAIGCNGTDCSNGLMNRGAAGDGLQQSSTMPRFAHVQPQPQPQQQQQHQDGTTTGSSLCDDKALITPPPGSKGSNRAAGMKVNSIYAQEHWHAAKDPRIFLNDPKDQNSPFQRAYSAVSANSPSSENRANLRRSVRDEPAPHPARLRKHRHGWTLHFGRHVNGTACTKSLVLVLLVLFALLGIGGIALYIVFEPEKLHVIQQYLRSSARNSTSGRNGSLIGPDFEEPVFPTSLPTSSFLDAILNASVSSLNNNNVPGFVNDGDLDDTPIFVTAWTSPPSSSTLWTTAAKSSTTRTSLNMTSTTQSTATTSTTTTARSFLEATARRRRPCHECYPNEVCVARNADEVPYCRTAVNPQDASGCAGYCDDQTQKCHKIEGGAFRCMEIEHHCLDDEWTCKTIFCIPLVKRCDGQMNCYDHSDEYNCDCNLETHFHCGNQTSCLPLSKKCDGHVDCFDASDEENCTTSHDLGRLCPSTDEFTCRNKQQCIRKSRFCDGYRDCKDGSDEPVGCNGRCNKHEFTCHNGRCIDKGDKCNGIDDCGDRSDEQHCRERL
ncbi:uncharacterized protein LOC100679901 isoform X2 [Nasonia vitripennis]|nr:uncharacterized protein LOC100679901 isoform X2 [Nasonia vitripennis]XP_032455250.1 uncharacterized protein LOC100679901 isoform X2 [Nasonia vitripennis]